MLRRSVQIAASGSEFLTAALLCERREAEVLLQTDEKRAKDVQKKRRCSEKWIGCESRPDLVLTQARGKQGGETDQNASNCTGRWRIAVPAVVRVFPVDDGLCLCLSRCLCPVRRAKQ